MAIPSPRPFFRRTKRTVPPHAACQERIHGISSRSSDLRISSIARLLGDRPNGRLSPVRCLALTAAAPSGNFTRFTILSAALDERRNTRHNLLVMDIIRTPDRFVNGILSGREKAARCKEKAGPEARLFPYRDAGTKRENKKERKQSGNHS